MKSFLTLSSLKFYKGSWWFGEVVNGRNGEWMTSFNAKDELFTSRIIPKDLKYL